MLFLKRTRLVLPVMVAITVTALIAGCGRERPDALSAKEAESDVRSEQVAGTAPPIPQAGLLARPRSLEQVGLPAELTRKVIAPDNPQTVEKTALGQNLFFDARLPADGTVACATCHDPARAFTDGRPTSIGIHGRAGQRNAPTILNALYNKTQFWDGRAKALEDQD